MDSCWHGGPALAAGVYMYRARAILRVCVCVCVCVYVCAYVRTNIRLRAQKSNDVTSVPLTPSSLPSSRPHTMQERALDDYTQKRTHIFALVARIGTHWLARTRSRRTQVRLFLQSCVCMYVHVYRYIFVCVCVRVCSCFSM